MARYIPTDETARQIARDWMRTQLTTELMRGSVMLQLGEMAEDGSCPVYLMAQQVEFDLRTMLDAPQIDGIAWIEESAPPRVEYDFGDGLQPAAFILEYCDR